jgi:hypothetical protein
MSFPKVWKIPDIAYGRKNLAKGSDNLFGVIRSAIDHENFCLGKSRYDSLQAVQYPFSFISTGNNDCELFLNNVFLLICF